MRRLLTLVAAASLLLCLAAVVLWVRSYWTRDCLSWRSPARPGAPVHSLWVLTGKGGILFNYGRDTPSMGGESFPDLRPPRRRFWVATGGHPYYPHVLRETIIKGAGFEVSGQSNRVGTDVHSRFNIVLPLWSVSLVLATLPAVLMVRTVRARHSPREGSCNTCGYDLRATPDRCPECGTQPSNSASLAGRKSGIAIAPLSWRRRWSGPRGASAPELQPAARAAPHEQNLAPPTFTAVH